VRDDPGVAGLDETGQLSAPRPESAGFCSALSGWFSSDRFLSEEVEFEFEFGGAEFAVVCLAAGSFVDAGAADDRFVGELADIHAGAVAGGGDDLSVGEAEDEGALLVAAGELGADAGVASDRFSNFEERTGDVAEIACRGAGGLGVDGEMEGRHGSCEVECCLWLARRAGDGDDCRGRAADDNGCE
jgi:hypothetical protein